MALAGRAPDGRTHDRRGSGAPEGKMIRAPGRRPTRLLDAVAVALLGEVVPETASGIWLRGTSLTGVIATAFVVVSGVLGGGPRHEVWVAIALPPLVALFATAVLTRRRLLWP